MQDVMQREKAQAFGLSSRSALAARAVRVVNYWEDRAHTFGLDGEDIERWGALMAHHLPCGAAHVLDVGCGTGAMSIPLAAHGYSVTSVDVSENMVERAAANLHARGLEARTLVASADVLPFAPASFDAVVCRNVLSNLVDPERALRQWRRVIKPGGVLMYFDSGWWHYLYDDALDSLRRAYYGTGSSSTFSELEAIAPDLPLSREVRPAWDRAFLSSLGMDVVAACDVSAQVWTEEERLRYSFAPQFMVAARVPASDSAVQ